MSLPANYKQVALGIPSPAPAQPTSSGSQRARASGSSSASSKEPASPFVHSPHGNPAFNPQKVTGKSSSHADTSRGPKPPKAPEKPLMPYMRYSRRVWDSVKVNYPEHKLWELGKIIGQMWRDLDDSERQVYIDEHEMEKIEYEKAIRTYHSSPAYQAFLAAKNKVKASDADTHESTSRPSKGSQQDRRIDIQPAEDEDDQDDGYSVKHVAYARFLRNHRLINEIFSDMAVPDVRTVVTTSRMQVLKRQVQSLTMHQMKLEAELLQMEDKFESKKRKLVESSEIFQDELKKHCKPAVDEEKFQKMVERQYELMKAERVRQLEGHSVAAATKLETIQRTEDQEMSVAPQQANTTSSATDAQPTEHEPMDTDSQSEPDAAKSTATAATPDATSDKSPVESDSNSNSNPPILLATKPMEVDKMTPEPSAPAADAPKDASPVPAPATAAASPAVVQPPPPNNGKPPTPNTFAPAMPPVAPHPTGAPPHNPAGPHAAPPGHPAAAAPVAQPSQQSAPLTHPNHPVPQPLPPHSESAPLAGGGGPPTATPPPPSQQPQTMPHHHGQPPQHNIPPHMAQHQAMPGHPGMPAHPPYGPFAGAGGPPRSPYYSPQYAGHPAQPPYHQYPPYPYHQQYGPPPSHYMNQRAPPQGGPPMHYPGEHGPPQPHSMDAGPHPGGPYAPAPHQMPPGSPQMGANHSPPVAGPPADHPASGDEKK